MNEQFIDGLQPLPLGVQNIGVYEDIGDIEETVATDLAIAEAEAEIAGGAALLDAAEVLRATRRRYR